ncbi:MAG: hypothetical protein M1269_09395 [Chloroflexi bacterium]|nr:hypothetical protein [Chloroflexota bacterium]
MRIDPIKSDSLIIPAHGKETAPGKFAEPASPPAAGDSVHLSKQPGKSPETSKATQPPKKETAPVPLKAKQAEVQTVPTFITEISESKSDSPKSKSPLTFEVIKAKEKPFSDIKKELKNSKSGRSRDDSGYIAKRDEFYKDIFADPELMNRSETLIHQWAEGGKGYKNLDVIKDAYTRVLLEGKKPQTDTEKTVFDMLATRRERWNRLAEKLDIKPPDSFHVYRGVKGEYAVDAVVKAWSDDSGKYMNIPNKELSSWSLDHEVAKDFASSGPKPSVVYETDIPFSRTLMDKYVDDNHFIKGYYSEEEVVVAASPDSIRVPKELATVKFEDKIYTYEERAELIKAWNQRPTGFFHKIAQAISYKYHDAFGG